MSVDRSFYLGPYFLCKLQPRVLVQTTRPGCRKHGAVNVPAKFCPQCGEALEPHVIRTDTRDSTCADDVERLTGWKIALMPGDGARSAMEARNVHWWLPNVYADFYLRIDPDREDFLHEMEFEVEMQKLAFAEAYSTVLSQLYTAYGATMVSIEWGLFYYAY